MFIIFIIILIVFKRIYKYENLIKISIILPIFNDEKYLSQCLKSILNQSLKNIEIICINDGSKDKSLKILRYFKKLDNRIKIISQKNKGSGIARNKGIKKSRGKYLAFIDSDDLYPNNLILELLYNKSIINNVSICGGGLNKFKERKKRLILINDNYDYIFKKEGIINYSEYEYDYGFFRFIYNKKFIIKNKAMHYAKKFYALNKTTYLYRRNHKDVKWNRKKVIDFYNGFYDSLLLSKKFNLKNLYCKMIKRLNLNMFLKPTKEFINDTNIKSHIFNILKTINFNNLKEENCSFKLNETYNEFFKLNINYF